MNARYSRGLSFAVLLVLVPASTLVLNLADPPLKPEVRKILDVPAPEASEAARRAYAFTLGMLAGERTDPERRGTEVLSHLDDAKLSTGASESPWRVDFGHCGGDVPVPCWIDQLTPENERALKDNRDILDLYVRLMEYADFVALGRPNAARTFDPVSMPSPALHRLFTSRLAAWVKAGGEERAWSTLESSTRFYAAVLRRGDTLLTRMIALVEIDANAQVIRAEMARRPRWTPPATLVDAFDLPAADDILGGALEDETRVVYQMIQGVRSGWRRLFLRPNETINRVYDLDAQIFFTDCPEATAACVPALAELDHGLRRYLVNQVGEQIVRTVVANGSLRAKMIKRMQNILEMKAAFRRRP